MELFKDKRENLEVKAANFIAKKILETLKEKGIFVLALCGGTSVEGIFRELGEKNLPWKKIEIFLTDERLIPLDNDDSNYKLIKEKLGVGEIHSVDVDQEDFLEDYTEQLKDFSDNFDLVLLSSGEDGHIASLFPNHHTIHDDSEFFIKTESAPVFTNKRISASRKLIERSKTAMILFFGKKKRAVLNKFFDKSSSIEECPAKIVHKIKDSYVFTDLK